MRPHGFRKPRVFANDSAGKGLVGLAKGNDLSCIGDRVRAARERAGISREALAFHSGLSWSAIAQVETGRRTNLRPGTLAALANALGLTIDYLVFGQNPGPAMLEHRALFYENTTQFVTAAAAFLSRGVERSEATLAVTSSDKVDALRERLGTRAKRVKFADHLEWYRTPSEALTGYRDFLKAALTDGATWVRILGEPVWRGRAQAKIREWSKYESLLNLVFNGEPVTVLCSYDRSQLDAEVIEHAYATHRDTIEHEVLSPSPSYGDPSALVLGD
jgi:transcriptional regulator with XRE-family HTH domain